MVVRWLRVRLLRRHPHDKTHSLAPLHLPGRWKRSRSSEASCRPLGVRAGSVLPSHQARHVSQCVDSPLHHRSFRRLLAMRQPFNPRGGSTRASVRQPFPPRGGARELPPGTAEVIPRPVGTTTDEVCFSVPPPLLGHCPATPVDGDGADAVQKGGTGAARGARAARATWSGSGPSRTDGADEGVDCRSATAGMSTPTAASLS